MKLKGFSRSLCPLSLIPALALITSTASADSACKGLDETACNQNASCNWISSYTTKNGNTVSAYCRSAGSKQKQGLNLKQQKGSQSTANDRADSGSIPMTTQLEERNG